jgi:hypothetical protein
MRMITVFVCLVLAVSISGCDSEDQIAADEPAAKIDDLRVELTCLGSGTASVNCDMPDASEDSSTIDGEAGMTYIVTIRIRGVVEQKTYTDYTESDGMWIVGGTPDGGTWNIFMLTVSDPPQTYYMNSGSSGFDECWELNTQKTVLMEDGATMTLLADSGGDLLGTINLDGNDEPIVISGVPPYPYAFDGQFVQIDIVDVEIE